jgi:hypothetical protein
LLLGSLGNRLISNQHIVEKSITQRLVNCHDMGTGTNRETETC